MAIRFRLPPIRVPEWLSLRRASGLPVAARLGLSAPKGSQLFVAVAEIDRFRSLRRRVGYTVANELVGVMGQRLRGALPEGRVGRVGRAGVEFIFPAAHAEAAVARLREVVAALERPFAAGGFDFDLHVSVGAAEIVAGAPDDRLIDRAAVALVEAQERHEKVRLAEQVAPDADTFDQLSMMRELRHAMSSGELQVHYQPKLRARTDTIDAAEALLRWFHPRHGQLRTDQLIEIAEETGAIRELTRWVLHRVLADQARLRAGGIELRIFVNLSGVVLPDGAFADWALDRLAGIEAQIGFEITETAVIRDPADAIANLQRFADAGIKIAIDDYGSGLSSLAYLKQLPAHELKIDRMFVSGLCESHRDPLLVRSSIDLAHALEMEVTAEGVDDVMALSLLRVMGCDLIQGYLIAKALPLAELEEFLRTDAHRARIAPPSLAGWRLQA
jgi:diguanylate cyclase